MGENKSELLKELQNLHQRINTVMHEVSTILKDTEVVMPKGSYKAVSHDSVTSALHMPMTRNGIVLKVDQKSCLITEFEVVKTYNGVESKSRQYRADVTVELTLINMDDPSDRETSTFSAYAFDTSDKATGKALSMAVKNGLLKSFMLESLDHEEERIEEGSSYRQRPQNAGPVQRTPTQVNRAAPPTGQPARPVQSYPRSDARSEPPPNYPTQATIVKR